MRLKEELDRLYLYYNNRKFVHPDPLEFLYNYNDMKDREIVGLVASSLAYGRVTQILGSVSLVLAKMTPTPSVFLKKSSNTLLYGIFTDFKHRFTTGRELSCLLVNIKNAIMTYGSLNACFTTGMKKEDETILTAALNFAKNLNASQKRKCSSLMPSPAGGSAFKRLNLYLRWMVRRDNVDPGGWDNISRSKLIIPLDTHMYRISLKLGLTKRKQADIRTALEVTDSFKRFDKDDPVKYDFALTRLGMNKIENTLLKECII
jgi:uncharacterized protein (TIGR02757 family)